jgi:hypothetical protein
MSKLSYPIESPKTQSIEAVKVFLIWKKRAVDPMPSTIEFMQEGDGRMILVLSNRKDSYYVTTATKCSCPSATYQRGPCKHQRKYFPQATATVNDSIEPIGKWPGGLNGPVDPDELKAVA